MKGRALTRLFGVVPLLGSIALLGCTSAAVPQPVSDPDLVIVPVAVAPESPPESAPPPSTEQELGEQVAQQTEASEAEDTREDDPEKLAQFRQELSSSGAWVEDARYGTVWVPHPSVVGVGFVPYVSAGHWTLTPHHHWVWVSEHPFGPVVFHYGRWVWSSSHGWVWIPGTRYSTAWVRFWHSGPYIGWAPLAPTYVWRHGAFVWVTSTPIEPCVFVHRRHVLTPYVPERSVRNSHHFRKLARSARPVQRPTPEPAPRGRAAAGAPGAVGSAGAPVPGAGSRATAVPGGIAPTGAAAASPKLRRYRAEPLRPAHEMVQPVPKRRASSNPSRPAAGAVVLSPPRVAPGATQRPTPAQVLRARRADAASGSKAKLPQPTAKPRVKLNKVLEARRSNSPPQAPRRSPPSLKPPANKESLKYKGGFKKWTPPAKLRPAPARQAPRRPPPPVRRKR